MTISSRTPEGQPYRCPVCGKACAVDPSYPAGDAPCPNCGHLLWWFRDHLERLAGVSPDAVSFDTSFLAHLGMDALDLAGLNALVEEAFGLHIPEGEAGTIKTIADAIRYIEKHRGEGQPPQPLGFAPGDRVRVCDGTFLGQEGEVTSLRERYGMVTVRLEMYGRPVPVELEAWQIALVAD